MSRSALALILAASTLAGCSLSISGPSSRRNVAEAPVCDTGKGLVALDGLMAIGLGIGGLAALSEDQGTGAIAIVGAALFTAAALHGSSNADKCRAAFDKYAKETRSYEDRDELVRRVRRRSRQGPVRQETPAPLPAKHVPAPRDPDPALLNRLPSNQPNDPPPTKQVVQPSPPPPKQPPPTDDWSQFWREVQP